MIGVLCNVVSISVLLHVLLICAVIQFCTVCLYTWLYCSCCAFLLCKMQCCTVVCIALLCGCVHCVFCTVLYHRVLCCHIIWCAMLCNCLLFFYVLGSCVMLYIYLLFIYILCRDFVYSGCAVLSLSWLCDYFLRVLVYAISNLY